MAKRDYYEVLGVGKTADKDTIKKAYRKLAMEYHPDRNPGNKSAEDKFKEASEAYEVLSDEQKRGQYDRFGHAGVGTSAASGGGAGMGDMDDIFSRFSDIFNDPSFNSFFGNAGRGGARGGRRRRGQRGSDLRIKIKLTLEEIAEGVEKKIKLRRFVACRTCNGSGAADDKAVTTCTTCKGMGEVRQQVGGGFFSQIVVSACPTCGGEGTIITNTCKTCKGEGRTESEDTIPVRIPAGVVEGMQLSLRGNGHAGRRGGEAGDLLIQVEEERHPYFTREGDNVIFELYLNFADAALGMSAEVPTLGKGAKARFKIDPGTQGGKIVRLKGKGIPNINGYGAGDQLIHINVWTPTDLSSEERKTIENFRKSKNFTPNPPKDQKGFFERMREYFN
jgi:molecular chaperone DnaJ